MNKRSYNMVLTNFTNKLKGFYKFDYIGKISLTHSYSFIDGYTTWRLNFHSYGCMETLICEYKLPNTNFDELNDCLEEDIQMYVEIHNHNVRHNGSAV